MTKLLSCPFCDEEPSFTDVELKDERRYAEKLLRCCSIEMSATLSFGQYKGLTDAQIDHQLRSELVKNWNTRVQPQPVPKRTFAFPEIVIDWDGINAMQFANSRVALLAKLERFMSDEHKDTAYWTSNHFTKADMHVLHELLKASSPLSRPEQS